MRRPSEADIAAFLEAQGRCAFSYAPVGGSAATPPAGFLHDQARVRIGQGEADFARARQALSSWRQFRLGWVELFRADTPIEVGRAVAILARPFGIWCLNACRIVYTIDEPTRFGFGYGTLPDHVCAGEERFLIEWNRDDDSVWFEIQAFSRPRHFLAYLTFPYLRSQQARFRRNAGQAMQLGGGK